MPRNREHTGGNDAPRRERRIRVNPDVVSQRLGDAEVLVHLKSGWIYELDATGVVIWDLLRDGLSQTEVIRRLDAMFDSEANELATDTEAFLEMLAGEALIEFVSEE